MYCSTYTFHFHNLYGLYTPVLVRTLGLHSISLHGQAISNELQNKLTVTLAEPVHTPAIIHGEARHQRKYDSDRASKPTAGPTSPTVDFRGSIVTAAVDPEASIEASMKLALLNNGLRSQRAISSRQWTFRLRCQTRRRPSTATSGDRTERETRSYSPIGAKRSH
jgi:hypothetical protein